MREPVRDIANEIVLPIIGAALLAVAWWYGLIPFEVIKYILTENL